MTKELLFQKAMNWATWLHANTLLVQMTSVLPIDKVLHKISNGAQGWPDERERLRLEFCALQSAFLTTVKEVRTAEVRTVITESEILRVAERFWFAIENKCQSDLQSYARIYVEDGPLPYENVAKADIEAYELSGQTGLYFSELTNTMISSGIIDYYRF